MKALRISILLVLVVFISSCNSDDNGLNDELMGKWTYTKVYTQYDQIGITELEIFNDFTFARRTELYTSSDGQTLEDLTQWQEYAGLLRENDDQLTFTAKRSAWFSIAEENPGPFTFTEDIELYEGSVDYTLIDNVLTFTYISFANDAPVETIVRFTRVD